MNTDYLFLMEDVIFKQYGLYAMWSILYVCNLVVLLVDGTEDESRDFNMIANGLSVIYCGIASANSIMGTKLPSTIILVGGPIHQYLYWLLFAYYKAKPVLGSHPIGVMNWVTSFVVGLFTLDMIVKTWILSFKPEIYLDYVKRKTVKNTEISSNGPVEESKSHEIEM